MAAPAKMFCITNDGKHTLAPGTLGLANGLGGRVLDTWWIKANYGRCSPGYSSTAWLITKRYSAM